MVAHVLKMRGPLGDQGLRNTSETRGLDTGTAMRHLSGSKKVRGVLAALARIHKVDQAVQLPASDEHLTVSSTVTQALTSGIKSATNSV